MDNNRWTGRLDQNWNARHSTHGTVSYFDSISSSPRWISALQPVGVTTQNAYTASIEHTWVLAPTTILNIRGGAVRSTAFAGSEVDVDTSSWNLPAQVINLLGGTRNRAPNISTGSHLYGLGGGNVNDARDTSYTGSFAIQKLLGKHTLKLGYEHRRYY